MLGRVGFDRHCAIPGRYQDGLSVIVVCDVVAVAMHRPEQIFLQAMGMAMLGNNLGMILKGLHDLWNM